MSQGEPDPDAGRGFRPPTDEEKETLTRLLSQPFPGGEALVQQLQSVTVKVIDLDGSLGLKSTAGPIAKVERRIPVEAETVDQEGETVHLLLHVVEGRMIELEIFREDAKPPQGKLGELRLLIF